MTLHCDTSREFASLLALLDPFQGPAFPHSADGLFTPLFTFQRAR